MKWGNLSGGHTFHSRYRYGGSGEIVCSLSSRATTLSFLLWALLAQRLNIEMVPYNPRKREPLCTVAIRAAAPSSPCSSAGLRNICLHDLRHTCATLLLSQGTHPKLVQELPGHATIATTIQEYKTTSAAVSRSADRQRYATARVD